MKAINQSLANRIVKKLNVSSFELKFAAVICNIKFVQQELKLILPV